MSTILLLTLCFLIAAVTSNLMRFMPAWRFLQASRFLVPNCRTTSDSKQVWIVWVLFLLLWEILVGLVKEALVGMKLQIVLPRLCQFSLNALFSVSVVPHRAYPLTCCLLQ